MKLLKLIFAISAAFVLGSCGPSDKASLEFIDVLKDANIISKDYNYVEKIEFVSYGSGGLPYKNTYYIFNENNKYNAIKIEEIIEDSEFFYKAYVYYDLKLNDIKEIECKEGSDYYLINDVKACYSSSKYRFQEAEYNVFIIKKKNIFLGKYSIEKVEE